MYRFYVDSHQIGEHQIRIVDGDVNHIKNVLRLKPGEEVILCDGCRKEYVCVLRELYAEEIIAEIKSSRESETELPVRITLFQGLPKKDKMELIIQKAVELGIYEIVPVMTRRTIVKLEDGKKEAKKLERWQSIAESAAKQSHRGYIPIVKPVMSYKEALQAASKMDLSIIPFEHAKNMEATREQLRKLHDCKEAAVFIGPEGGFEDSEIELAMEKNVAPVTLGKRILRTETAGMAVLAMMIYEIEP